MFENGQLSQPRWWLRLLFEAAWAKAVKVEVLLKNAPPFLPAKVLVDVADGDLPEVGRAAGRLAAHLNARPQKFYLSCRLA